ncbi:hypothetical protein ACH5RR_018333 [Cinchona calisaya]|uniref:Neprosin activation peptide domain-containing protein n=1 Tax=Cinchona calisaya TaxID=153742 RepID=A0ABD2ZL44_9GENT
MSRSLLVMLNGSCPEGTIPIRRTSNEDVLRASSIKKNGKKKQESIPDQLSSANRTFDIQGGHEGKYSVVEQKKKKKKVKESRNYLQLDGGDESSGGIHHWRQWDLRLLL